MIISLQGVSPMWTAAHVFRLTDLDTCELRTRTYFQTVLMLVVVMGTSVISTIATQQSLRCRSN
jgi:hypothetical protein